MTGRALLPLAVVLCLPACGDDDPDVSANRNEIARSVAQAFCQRHVEAQKCPSPDGLPWCTDTINKSECVSGRTASIIVEIEENPDIDLEAAATLAELCIEAIQALTCEDYDSYDNCHNYEAYPSACESFEDYLDDAGDSDQSDNDE